MWLQPAGALRSLAWQNETGRSYFYFDWDQVPGNQQRLWQITGASQERAWHATPRQMTIYFHFISFHFYASKSFNINTFILGFYLDLICIFSLYSQYIKLHNDDVEIM